MIERPTPPPADVLAALMEASEVEDDNGLRVPLRLLIGLAWVESRYNPRVVNPRSGAQGLMQFMPEESKALHIDPFNLLQATTGAAHMLLALHRALGDWDASLAGYEWGIGKVQKHRSPGLWPPEVRQYIEDVREAARTVRLPFKGQVVHLSAQAGRVYSSALRIGSLSVGGNRKG